MLKAMRVATALALVYLAAREEPEQATLELVVIDGCPAYPQLLDQGSDDPEGGSLRRVLHHAGHVSRRKNAEKARTRNHQLEAFEKMQHGKQAGRLARWIRAQAAGSAVRQPAGRGSHLIRAMPRLPAEPTSRRRPPFAGTPRTSLSAARRIWGADHGQVRAMFTAIIRSTRPSAPGVGRDVDLGRHHSPRRAECGDPAGADQREPDCQDGAAASADSRPRRWVCTPYRVGKWCRSGERARSRVWTTTQTAPVPGWSKAPTVCRLPSDRAARVAPW